MTASEVEELERVLMGGGVALFPSDTVYGLAADPESEPAVARLNALKGRDPAQPSAVMFFSVARAEPLLADLDAATRAACERLLPGSVTLVLANPRLRFPLACGRNPDRIGLRVPVFAGALAPLESVSRPVLQSSANLHGGADPRTLADVPAEIRARVDCELDGGELPGIASTVVDLTAYADGGGYAVLREGAVSSADLERLL